MELRTNCKGCGAPLHYKNTDYGKVAICEYCRQEYQIFDINLCGEEGNGRILIDIYGQPREFYISQTAIYPIFRDFCRDLKGNLKSEKITQKIKLELIEI